MKLPKIGDKVYLPSQYYISRGEDDIEGGIAEIDRIIISENLPLHHYNAIMIGFKGFDKARSWNYRYILENQKDWCKSYKGKFAHHSPDINTPWITKGDLVDGVVYNGPNIY